MARHYGNHLQKHPSYSHRGTLRLQKKRKAEGKKEGKRKKERKKEGEGEEADLEQGRKQEDGLSGQEGEKIKKEGCWKEKKGKYNNGERGKEDVRDCRMYETVWRRRY